MKNSLEPVLDVVQLVHGHRVDVRGLLGVVLEDEDDVEALQVELDTLKVNQFDAVQDDDERRLGEGGGGVRTWSAVNFKPSVKGEDIQSAKSDKRDKLITKNITGSVFGRSARIIHITADNCSPVGHNQHLVGLSQK